jgi:hypothetical protein
MATNKIYFNSTTTPITLNGIYWNGTKIEGCKGINLNGTVVVSFDTVSHLLKWSDYTNAYNAVWISGDTSGKMAKMTAENEFAVVRSRWMLYNRIGLFEPLGISDYRLFNFNSDGRIYVKDVELADYWAMMYDMMPNDGTGVITITVAPDSNSVSSDFLANYCLTGLPLVFKTDEGAFQATTILNGDLSNITKQGDAYRIILGNPNNTLSYTGDAITATDIKDAIERQLGITATIQEADTAIDLGDTADWGEFELLDALSNVYVQGFGPYGEITDYSDGVYPDYPNTMYYLKPNMNFTPQEYWNVPNESKIPIEIKSWDYYGDTMGCDFYILTAWGNNVIGNPAVGDTVDLAGSYYAQGDGNDGKPENEYVNITYFDISSFAETQYPNFLCYMSMVFQNFTPSTIYENGDITMPKWIGVNTDSSLIGSVLTSAIFPSGCPYDINSESEPSVDDITVAKWKTANDISMECDFAIDQTYEVDYFNESLAPDDIASDLLEDYAAEFPEKFERSSSSTAKKFPLKLKMRTYPSYATGNGATGAPELKWYLNAWDPLNAGGYYPVKKTKRDVAGRRYNTYVSYTAQ